jgi:hypothetical protein
MPKNTAWTSEEDIILSKGVMEQVSPVRLAVRLRRSLNSVKRRIRELGLVSANRDPIVVRIDPVIQVRRWMGTAKAKDLNGLIDFYSDEATLECACAGATIYAGLSAIGEYWAPKLRMASPLAFSLVKATRDDARVVSDYLSYEAKPVRISMTFDATGKITRSECAPHVGATPKS